MNNIEQYKKRFFNLMESTIGDVKPLLTEQISMYGNTKLKSDYTGQGGSFEKKQQITPTKENINPKNLKMGDGGKQSPQLKNDVIQLQQKLMDLKLLNIQKPTGFFGEKTNAALQKFMGGTKLDNTTKTSSIFTFDNFKSKASEFLQACTNPLKFLIPGFLVKEAIKAILPLHLKAFLMFLESRKDTFTEKELDETQFKILEKAANNTFKKKECKNKKSCGLDIYKMANFSFDKMKAGKNKQFFPDDDITEVALFLGNVDVIDNGDHYIISDIYDFNGYQDHPEKYTLESMPNTIKDSLKKIFCDNYIQGVEQLAAYRHKMGYKGYPVKIRIEKTA